MSSIDEIKEGRLKKLQILKDAGINPYPAKTNRELALAEAVEQFEELEKAGEPRWLAGRVMSIRGQGAINFVTLRDGTGDFQALLKRDALGEEKFGLFGKTIDIGDFVEVQGTFFVTKRGEQTIEVKDWNILTKTLLPLPDKWHGLQDAEERYRKRYLDMLMDPDLKGMFERKAKFWQAAREFLVNEGFLEVRTPTLELTTGGAEANPFRTHHDDFDIDVYLRISVGELWQKRLMAAGFPRTFEMGRIYRNEGTSPEHLQEFDNLEFYAAYMSFDEGLALVERHFKYVIDKTFDGQMKFKIRDFDVDFSGENWERVDYVDAVLEKTGINVLEATEEEMKKKLEELGVEYEGANRERLTDTLWKYCRKQIAGPVWLVGHPKLVSPLSKADPNDERKTLRAQLMIAGSELCNGFAELNDPIDQRERFELQQELIESGDNEAMMSDLEFVEMLEHGMPPTFGTSSVGERLFAFLMDKPVRETQLFPLMKPKN
jgi:lysyl-tRNA synthetase class 2